MGEKEFLFSKTVFLTDTNAEGNVYFARYFEWQGMAREDFFRKAVPNHMEILRSGTRLITVHAWLKYEHELHLFDEIEIKIRTTSLKKMSMELEFTYLNKQTNQVVAIGGQKLAFADQSGQLIGIPTSIRTGAATCLVTTDAQVWHLRLIRDRAEASHRITTSQSNNVRQKQISQRVHK